MIRRGYSLWFYGIIYLLCLINGYDFMANFHHLLPTHVFLIAAYFDGAFKDPLGYIIKNYKYILVHILFWYILPYLYEKIKGIVVRYITRIINKYEAKKMDRINHTRGLQKSGCRAF